MRLVRGDVRKVWCPECGAPAGGYCLNRHLEPRVSCHLERYRAAKQQRPQDGHESFRTGMRFIYRQPQAAKELRESSVKFIAFRGIASALVETAEGERRIVRLKSLTKSELPLARSAI